MRVSSKRRGLASNAHPCLGNILVSSNDPLITSRAKHAFQMLSLVFCGLLLATVGATDDWPAWGGPTGRNRSAESSLPGTFNRHDGTNIKWSVPLGTVAFGCPTIADGRVFIGTNYPAIRDDNRFTKSRGGVLVCLDEATGEILWRLVAPDREDGFPEHAHMINQRWGISSSPAVDSNRVYVITNGDDLLCLDVHGLANGNDGPFTDEAGFMTRAGSPPIELAPMDADIVWRYDIPRELNVAPHDLGSCSVLIIGDVLYTSTSNGLGTQNPTEALMPDAPAFIAVDKRTGRLLAVDDTPISQNLFHAQWSSPSKARIGNRSMIFVGGGDGFCYAFADIADVADEDAGHLTTVWTYDCNPHHYKFTEEGNHIWYYQGDTRVYKQHKTNNLGTAGLNSNDGTFVGPNEVIATPVFHDGRIYIATGRDPMHGLGRGVLHCIDATQSGDISESGRVWSYEGIGRTFSSVSVDNGLVYASELSGKLHCLDAATGVLYWVHDTGEETWANPLLADGKVYLNTRQSFWVLAAGREKRVLFKERGGSETAPVVANGVLYAFIKGRLYAIADGIASRPKTDEGPANKDLAAPEVVPINDAAGPADELPFLEMPRHPEPQPQTPPLPWLMAMAGGAFALVVLFVLLRRK